MGGISNTNPPAPLAPGKWIGKIILAVILGEAIWGLLVSLTNGLIVPGLARVMGGDPQSPVYLGKGDFNLTGIFVSILELCLAGIVAILLNQWSSGPAGGTVRTVKVRTVKSSIPSITATTSTAPAIAPQSSPIASEHTPLKAAAAAQSVASPMSSAPTATPPSTPQPTAPIAKPAAKPEKSEQPAEVYYNIVGEPINPTEDDG